MKYIAAILLALSIPVAALAADHDTQKATDAAKSWLALIDAKDYAQSWKTASALFRSHVTQAEWVAAAKAALAPLGPVVARNATGAKFTTSLPGAPDGQYVVVTFDTKFANKAAATETAAMAMEGGTWKDAGYHVR